MHTSGRISDDAVLRSWTPHSEVSAVSASTRNSFLLYETLATANAGCCWRQRTLSCELQC
jgi:hypothetical protein